MKTTENMHKMCFMKDKCKKYDVCPMVLVNDVISGKRKILILWYLSESPLRFNELRRKLPNVTHKMLTQQLRALENDGFIKRTVYPEVPPKVEYSLSELGINILPILELMHSFGTKHLLPRVNR